jgi:hypothetical protein
MLLVLTGKMDFACLAVRTKLLIVRDQQFVIGTRLVTFCGPQVIEGSFDKSADFLIEVLLLTD